MKYFKEGFPTRYYVDEKLIDAYYKDFGVINNSSFKLVKESPEKFLEYFNTGQSEFTKNASFDIGSLVDQILLTKTPIEDVFYPYKGYIPNGTKMGIFVHSWLTTNKNGYPDETNSFSAYVAAGYSYPLEKVLVWANEDKIKKYIDACRLSKKIVISEDDYNLALRMATVAQTDDKVSSYFIEPPFETSKELLYIYQLPLKFEYLEEPCKGLLDLCVIDLEKKQIYALDLKTAMYLKSFEDNFFKYNYHTQGTLYKEGLKELVKGNCTIPKEVQEFLNSHNVDLTEFTTSNTEFIVVSKMGATNIGHYQMTDNTMRIGLYGESSEKRIYGVNDYIKAIKYHLSTGSTTPYLPTQNNKIPI